MRARRRVTRIARSWAKIPGAEVLERQRQLDLALLRNAAEARRTVLGARIGRTCNGETAGRAADLVEQRHRGRLAVAHIVTKLTTGISEGRCPFDEALQAGHQLVELGERRST